MYTPSFDELVGRESDFFSAYRDRRPLHRQGAVERAAREILSIADLDAILHLEAIRPPYIRIMKDGVMVPHSTFTAPTRVQGASVTDTVVPEKVQELLRSGATVTWAAINHFRPNLRALTRMLTAKFATESAVTAFLTPPGRSGICPQHSYFDVFVIQLEGSSGWALWPIAPTRRGDTRRYQAGELGEPVMEVSLRPGDVLYLPWGTPHVTAAQEQVSLHLSVMVRVRLWSDLLALTVRRLLDDPVFWQFPYLNQATTAGQAQVLADRAGELARRLAGLDPAAEIARLIEAGQHSPGSALGGAFQQIAASPAGDEPQRVGAS